MIQKESFQIKTNPRQTIRKTKLSKIIINTEKQLFSQWTKRPKLRMAKEK